MRAEAETPYRLCESPAGNLWDSVDLGFKPTKRTWGAEVFPGSSLPNAMVQVSPVTKFHSGAGYQYEDSVIYGFTHTNKGHWNLCHIPLLPVTGTPLPGDYCSPYSHARESAAPGYYRVFLDRYGVDAELTSTLRCAFHKYTYPAGAQAALLAKHAKRAHAHVNLIPLNHVDERSFEPTPPERLSAFRKALEREGVNVTVRRRLGGDIDASCGQLRKKTADAPAAGTGS